MKTWHKILVLLFLLPSPNTFADQANPDSQSKSIQPVENPAASSSDNDEDVPAYVNASSHWAIAFRAAKAEFPLAGSLGDSYQFLVEYMLPATPIGILSIGTHFGSFPIKLPSTGLTYPVYGNTILGVQARYQMKFMKNQFFIPVGGVEWDHFNLLKIQSTGETLSGNGFGLTAGFMLNLNSFDKKTVRASYDDLGLVRTYFTAELKFATLNSDFFDQTGIFWFWGIRAEFE